MNTQRPIPEWLKDLMPNSSEDELREAEENFWQFILALIEVNKRVKAKSMDSDLSC